MFLWRMEDVLSVYQLPYDPLRPVICYDERPCLLIGDQILPLPIQPGKPKREDYHYQRNGVANLLIAYEPLTGRRYAQITERRTKKEYAQFLKRKPKKSPRLIIPMPSGLFWCKTISVPTPPARFTPNLAPKRHGSGPSDLRCIIRRPTVHG